MKQLEAVLRCCIWHDLLFMNSFRWQGIQCLNFAVRVRQLSGRTDWPVRRCVSFLISLTSRDDRASSSSTDYLSSCTYGSCQLIIDGVPQIE